MHVENYFTAGIVTIFIWFCDVFFAYGGFFKRRLFWRLCKTTGAWRRNWLLMAVFACFLSFYGIWLYGASQEYITFMLLAAYLGAVTITDLRSREIPDDATVFFAVLFVLWLLLSKDISIIFNGILGAIVGAVIPFVIYFIRRDAIGFGDIKLLACTGLLAGCPGILFILLRAMVFGAVFSVGLLLLKKGTLKTELPFAPFVLLAAVI